VMALEEAPDPTPEPGEIVIAVEAAGVNPADYKFRNGSLAAFFPKQMPYVPGMDVAGRVIALGEGVTGFEVGDRVFGLVPCAVGNALFTLGDPGVAVPRVAPPMLDALRDQAGLQLHRRRTDELTRHLLEPENERGLGLLPPPSPGDLFFDMEGDPFFEAAGGLEFLFGVLARRPDGGTDYTAIRARNRKEERKAFEQFIDLVHTRLAEHPDMHVYHYAAYEPATLSRLMGAHATREAEVDDLLRREILVDLYRVVRQGLRAGVRSYSLKEIEQFFFTRQADVKSGNDAVLSFEQYLEDGIPHVEMVRTL